MKIFLTGGSSGIGKVWKEHLNTRYQVHSPTRTEFDLCQLPIIDLSAYQCIILCAGTDQGGRTCFKDMPIQDYMTIINTNLIANMHLIHSFINSRTNQWSKIVVVGSTVTNNISALRIPYATSKIALESFCRGIQKELPEHIGLTLVRPGTVRTGFHWRRMKSAISVQQANSWYDNQTCMDPSQMIQYIDFILDDHQHLLQELTVECLKGQS